jgi:ferric-dicitrate binding protein FerR (iron transport regulator)
MNFDQDDFLLLLLRQLDDCTSWEEELYIERTLRSNAAARQLLEDVKETFLTKEYLPEYTADRHYFKDIDLSNRVDETLPLRLPARRKKRYLSIAAAAMVTIVTGASAYFFPASDQQQPAITDVKAVTLRMAGGNDVQLGNGVTTIAAKGVELNTNASMLRFTAKTGSHDWENNTIVVPPGYMYSITLADGSIVHMNAATFLRFPFSFKGRTREVYIDGEAFFSVAPNPQQPFMVHTKRGDVSVLGTSFNINTYDDNFMVSLISGAVAITNKQGEKKVLTPCKAAVMDTRNDQLAVVGFDSDQVLGWLHGLYRFQQQSLCDVSKIAARWYAVKIRFDSEKLARLKYSGIINKKEPIQVFLKKLKDNGKTGDYYFDWEGAIHLSLKGEH